VKDELKAMLEMGLIEELHSAWASPRVGNPWLWSCNAALQPLCGGSLQL